MKIETLSVASSMGHAQYAFVVVLVVPSVRGQSCNRALRLVP